MLNGSFKCLILRRANHYPWYANMVDLTVNNDINTYGLSASVS